MNARIPLSRCLPALLALAVSVWAGTPQAPRVDRLQHPQQEDEPRVVEEKDIPAAEVLTSKALAERGFTAREVIIAAHLDDTFRNHVDLLEPGAADGKALITDYVMIENGQETVDFVKKHGYRSFRGPVGVRQWKKRIEVDVRITGNHGKTMVITLSADGGRQGCG